MFLIFGYMGAIPLLIFKFLWPSVVVKFDPNSNRNSLFFFTAILWLFLSCKQSKLTGLLLPIKCCAAGIGNQLKVTTKMSCNVPTHATML